MSILEASYIIYLLRPHFNNFNKRIIKSPKLYFYDSGLLSYLLGVSSHEKLRVHSERGHIFETWVISEMLKGRFNRGLKENIYFWRDSAGHEIDCIIDNGDSLIPLEIKAGMTISQDFFKGIKYWSKISGIADESKYVVYAGSMDQARKEAKVINWKSFGNTVAQSL
jgi:predicted AAA+ superfamily ATPase